MHRIAITGASGQVGKLLVPLLMNNGYDLLLIGRNPLALRHAFPDVEACSYEELSSQLKGCSTLLHLACLNNDASATLSEFQKVNVDLALALATQCAASGVVRFVNISSVLALDNANTGHYAVTKREAAETLSKVEGTFVETVYLPMVYGRKFLGRLRFLNDLPGPFATFVFSAVSAFKPVVHIQHVVDHVLAAYNKKPFPVIIVDSKSENLAFRLIKRALDITFSAIVLLGFWWLLAAIWLAIRLDSKGSGILAQPRVGQNGNVFNCYKFRTMVAGTKYSASHNTPSAAVTRVGKFLRWTKLDELPQVWNILKNEMSLIGPRPCLPQQAELVEERFVRGVLQLKPGITGLAQVQGIDMRDPVVLANKDLAYLKLRSLILEFKILVATLRGKGSGDRLTGAQ